MIFKPSQRAVKYSLVAAMPVILLGCSPTPPETEFASDTGIAITYEAYDTVPTLTAEARDVAVKHCAKFGKFANYKGGNAVNLYSAEEVHQFACESTKTDDSTIIAAQSQRPDYVAVPTYNYAPTNTSCTTIGYQTNCHSY